jgi:hypothetical protein
LRLGLWPLLRVAPGTGFATHIGAKAHLFGFALALGPSASESWGFHEEPRKYNTNPIDQHEQVQVLSISAPDKNHKQLKSPYRPQ